MKYFYLPMVLATALALTGCAKHVPAQQYDYTALRAAKPHSILVVPVVNNTAKTDAGDTFFATLAMPLAERGYYVFPLNMVKNTMQENGMPDANRVAVTPTPYLASLFGADAVLYAEVNGWESNYAVLATTTVVSVHYILKSGKTGETLWSNDVTTTYSPQASGGNILADLIADAIIAAIESAHPSFIPAARQNGNVAFNNKDIGLLDGPYTTPH